MPVLRGARGGKKSVLIDNLNLVRVNFARIVDGAGNCPAGSTLQTNGAPMVHVWITPHACGPFAALEGQGAGVADEPDSVRVDKCNAGH